MRAETFMLRRRISCYSRGYEAEPPMLCLRCAHLRRAVSLICVRQQYECPSVGPSCPAQMAP